MASAREIFWGTVNGGARLFASVKWVKGGRGSIAKLDRFDRERGSSYRQEDITVATAKNAAQAILGGRTIRSEQALANSSAFVVLNSCGGLRSGAVVPEAQRSLWCTVV